MKTFPYYVANVAEAPNADLEVTDKYSGEVAYRVAMADAATIDRAIAAATDAAEPFLSGHPSNAKRSSTTASGVSRNVSKHLRCRCAWKPANRSKTHAAKSLAVTAACFSACP